MSGNRDLDRRHSQCKGPEGAMHSACSRKSNKAGKAAEAGQGGDGMQGKEEGTGPQGPNTQVTSFKLGCDVVPTAICKLPCGCRGAKVLRMVMEELDAGPVHFVGAG